MTDSLLIAVVDVSLSWWDTASGPLIQSGTVVMVPLMGQIEQFSLLLGIFFIFETIRLSANSSY